MQERKNLVAETDFRRTTRGPDLPFALALAALILFLASLALPLVRARLFGEIHAGYLLSGIISLWRDGDHVLSLVVVMTGLLMPLLLNGLLCCLTVPWPNVLSVGARRPTLLGFAKAVEHWAMPEVQVLGVLVAFTKLSALVPSQPAPGLICYAGAALLQLVAWRLCRPEATAATVAGHSAETPS